jgi:positive regulator of sigma E activity
MASENKLEQRGRIIKKISDNKVLVGILMEETSCKDCKEKGACGIKVFKTEYPDVEMFCNIPVNVGDEVVFSQKANYSLLASFLIFILPLIMMIVGYYIFGNIFEMDESYRIIGSFLFLSISFVFTYFVSKFLSKKSTQNMYVIRKI